MTITGLCVCVPPHPPSPTPGLRRTHQCDAHWKPQFATPDRNVSCARRETDLRSAHPHRAQPANESKASGECSGTLVAPPPPPTPSLQPQEVPLRLNVSGRAAKQETKTRRPSDPARPRPLVTYPGSTVDSSMKGKEERKEKDTADKRTNDALPAGGGERWRSRQRGMFFEGCPSGRVEPSWRGKRKDKHTIFFFCLFVSVYRGAPGQGVKYQSGCGSTEEALSP